MKMFKLLVLLILICGVIYPGAITLIGHAFFHRASHGSLVMSEGVLVGSELLAQRFTNPGYFHPRPSASDFATVASGASQSGPTQRAGLLKRKEYQLSSPDAGADAWSASASGLDPHISPKTAFAQVARVGAARGLSSQDLTKLIEAHIEGPILGIWGQPRVNVLKLNIALMNAGSHGNTR